MAFRQKEYKSLAQAVLETEESFRSQLTDVGLYCIGGLCAVSLVDLFSEELHSEFKKSALKKILKYLDQPKQTNESLLAILEGDVVQDVTGFVDTLLTDGSVVGKQQYLITDLVAVAIADGCYDARMRALIKHVAWQLRVTWDEVEIIEEDLAESLENQAYVMSEEELKEKSKKARNRKIKRYALIGLATVGGGALIGLTGGLAAPLVAAGAGAIIGGAGAAALGSVAGVAIIGSLFGVAGAGLTGYKMKKRVGAVEEFTFEPLTVFGTRLNPRATSKQLHITIAVTGWINDKIQDFRVPWACLAESKEQYSLRWESQYLHQMGEAFDYILQSGLSYATTEALKMTVLSGIIAAVAWPAALMSAANVIDNPWHVCTQRSMETGKQLAEVLLAREQGKRPVTLIGFSLGARVIFSCLEELAKRKGGEGLVEDVILLGAPVTADPKNWQRLEKVVAGKIVNGYSKGDWLLKFLFRTASVTLNVAGLGPVKWENRRMHNIDLSNVVSGHGDYIKNLDTIMKAVGVRTKDEVKPATCKQPGKSTSSQSVQATEDNRSQDMSPADGDTHNTEPVIADKTITESRDQDTEHRVATSGDGKTHSHQSAEEVSTSKGKEKGYTKSIENSKSEGPSKSSGVPENKIALKGNSDQNSNQQVTLDIQKNCVKKHELSNTSQTEENNTRKITNTSECNNNSELLTSDGK